MIDSEYETEYICKYPLVDLIIYKLNCMIQDFLLKTDINSATTIFHFVDPEVRSRFHKTHHWQYGEPLERRFTFTSYL